MSVRIAVVLPDLLGTYGDRGNVIVLRQRLRWRGIGTEVVEVTARTGVPQHCDLYVLGGGEDAAQSMAAGWLRRHPGIQRAASRGAVVFGVCAGLQILGADFTGPDGVAHHGLGLIDARTRPMPHRAMGELVVRPDPVGGLDSLTGFENHFGGTELGPAARPLGLVRKGTGNGFGGVEGAVQGRVIGTYLHGPALARNPQLADLLLSWVTGDTLPPLELREVTRLRAERLRAA